MLIGKTKIVHYFSVLMLSISFVFATDAEASKWSAIAEILERLFKSSDDMAEKQRAAAQGGIHGARPSLANNEQDQVTSQSDRQDQNAESFIDCLMSAQAKRGETMLAHVSDIVDAVEKGDGAELKRIDDVFNETYCTERVACNSLLREDQSYLLTDYSACMLEERYATD